MKGLLSEISVFQEFGASMKLMFFVRLFQAAGREDLTSIDDG